jgi:predicted enzyme involved in methoxymalonyl-ACP biosynthesis
MTRSTRSVEDLKDEFYQHCKDYVEKKKMILESNRLLEDRLKEEKKLKSDLQKLVASLQADIKDTQGQFHSLLNDLEMELRQRQSVESQKNGYKAKLRLANQRLKNMSNAMDDISLIIYHKIVNAEGARQEVDRIETIENEITSLTQMIKTREEELSHELTFAQRYLGHI